MRRRSSAAWLIVALLLACGCTSGGAADAIPLDCPTTTTTPDPITHAAGTLVEPDGIRSAMICRYDGSARLRQSGTVSDPARLAMLVSELNAGDPMPTGPINCPVMDGSSYTIYLTRAPRSGEAVVVEASGCRSVQHGSQGHWATDPLMKDLSSVAGARDVP